MVAQTKIRNVWMMANPEIPFVLHSLWDVHAKPQISSCEHHKLSLFPRGYHFERVVPL